MDERFKDKALSYLDKMEAAAAKVGEFAETEIPETIREWLLWLAVERFAYAAAFLAVAIVFVVVSRKTLAAAGGWKGVGNSPVGEPVAVVVILMWLASAGCFIGAGSWSLHGLKVVIAPRVVLVEEVAKIVKAEKK